MIRPRATTKLHRIAGEGLRSTLSGKKRLSSAVVSPNTASTGAVVSMHDHRSNSSVSVGCGIRSDSGRWCKTLLPPAQQQQRLCSCCFVGDSLRAATGGAGLISAPLATAAAASTQRAMSTSAASGKHGRREESPTMGAETANGITFETGKVRFLSCRFQQRSRANSGTGVD